MTYHVAKRAILNIVIAISVGVVVLTSILILKRIETVGQSVKDQTTINQKFLRCLILVTPSEFRTPEQRVVVVDKCVEESIRLDNKTASPDDQVEIPVQE